MLKHPVACLRPGNGATSLLKPNTLKQMDGWMDGCKMDEYYWMDDDMVLDGCNDSLGWMSGW